MEGKTCQQCQWLDNRIGKVSKPWCYRVGGRFDPDSPACEYFEENKDE